MTLVSGGFVPDPIRHPSVPESADEGPPQAPREKAELSPLAAPLAFPRSASSPTAPHPQTHSCWTRGVSILRAPAGVPVPGPRHPRGLAPLLGRKAW